jgi:glutamate synthase (NADPH/NADH) small chain
MEYLYARNRAVAAGQGRWAPAPATTLSAHQRHVVVIGGGDTAMDCVGNAHRELAASVTVLDSYVAPVGTRTRELAQWPAAPKRVPTSYALDEGGERLWQRTAIAIGGHRGHVSHVVTGRAGPAPDYEPVPGTEETRPADLVLIAIGFSGPEHSGPIEQLGLRLNARATIRTSTTRSLWAFSPWEAGRNTLRERQPGAVAGRRRDSLARFHTRHPVASLGDNRGAGGDRVRVP